MFLVLRIFNYFVQFSLFIRQMNEKKYVIYIFLFSQIWSENREEIHKKNLFERNFVEETL